MAGSAGAYDRYRLSFDGSLTMKTTLSATLFAALLAAAAMAPSAFAQSDQNGANNPPSRGMENQPASNPMSGMGGMMGRGGGGMMGRGEGGMMGRGRGGMMGHGRGGMMGRNMMGRHWMMGWKGRKEACIDRLAHHAAMLAYIGTKLDLTAQQRPLWQKVQTIASDTTQKELALCNAIKAGRGKTILDRLGHVREMLAIQVAGLTAALPELKSLYEALTPEQRAILDRPWMHHAWALKEKGKEKWKKKEEDEDND
jgi:hypothetical protein